MATVKFIVQGKTGNENIYLRLSINRNQVYKRKTEIYIDSQDWSKPKSLPIQKDEELKNKKKKLNALEKFVIGEFEKDYNKGRETDSQWLKRTIDKFHNRPEEEKLTLLRYFDHFIDIISTEPKKDSTGEFRSPRTIEKYKIIKSKVLSFNEYAKDKPGLENYSHELRLTDVGQNFITEFSKYLKEVDNISKNTIGRYITFLKTVCKDAGDRGYPVSKDLGKIKGYKVKTKFIVLSEEELKKVDDAKFTVDYLENARDWLLIGCNIGQRVSDLLKLTKNNIKVFNSIPILEITQQKTKKNISFPITKEINKILLRRNGDFPRKISDQRFNEYIKLVCKSSGIIEKTKGYKHNKETGRKEIGTYEKWELVTSHICRRSFATNYYGKMPTQLIMNMTGHASEKQFLEYIDKPQIDHAFEFLKYVNMIKQQEEETPKLNELRITI